MFRAKSLEKYVKVIVERISKFISLSLNIKKEPISKLLGFLFYVTESVIVVLFVQYFYLGNFTVPTGSMKPKIMPNDKYLADMLSYRFFDPKRGQIIIFNSPTNEIHFCKRLIALPGEKVKIGNDRKLYINGKKLEIQNEYYTYTSIDNMIINSLMDDNEWLVPKKEDTIQMHFALFKYFTNEGEVLKDIWQMRNLLNSMKEEEALKFLKDLKKNFKLEISKARVILNDKDLTGIIIDEDVLLKLIKGDKFKLKDDYYFALGDNTLKSEDSRYWGFIKKSRLRGRPIIRWWPLERINFVYSYPY
jgi:signal peptidase I